MSSPPPGDISIGFQHYDPYQQGWYLLPGAGDFKVPSSLAASTAASGLTIDQINELNAHTLQGLIELVYVRVGNDVLFQGLNGLDQALFQTSRTAQLLSQLQELHNAVEVSSLGSLSSWFVYGGDYEGIGATDSYNWQGHYQENYNAAASAFFGVPILPDFIFKNANSVVTINGQQISFAEYADQLATTKSQLRSDLAMILAQDPNAANEQNSLYGASLQVLCDLPPIKNGAITWTDAKLWALDYYTIDNGKDLAQADYDPAAPNAPWQTVFKISNVINELIVKVGSDGTGSDNADLFRAVSLSPANMPGLGTGQLEAGGSLQSYRAGPQGEFHLDGATAQTALLTFSGRMAFVYSTIVAGGVGSSAINVMDIIQLNPVDENGNVIRGITSGYLGSAGARGQDGDLAGTFQNNITTAITSAQGLNNSQTETVKSFMAIFEQYYKSASSALSSISSIITKFAQNTRPS